MSTLITPYSEIDWEDIILKLMAFTRSLASSLTWFRGPKTISFLMGKEAEDYVYAAIGKYLESPQKFDPTKGDLVDYLKYNLIRTLVGNDARKTENRLSKDVFANFDEDEDDENGSYLDRILPHFETLLPDDIDYNTIKEYIEKEIQGDKDVENIFLGLYSFGMKRREIIEEFNMTAGEYDNGMRRLNTVINRAALIFNKTTQSA